jgi:hypothetical protein
MSERKRDKWYRKTDLLIGVKHISENRGRSIESKHINKQSFISENWRFS